MLNLDWKPPVLETSRLIVRPLEIADVPAIFLYASNPNVTRFTLWNTHETLADTMAYVRDYAASRYMTREPEPVGIVLKDDPTNSVIGTVGCHWISRDDAVMELGYNLAEPYWGRGLVVEASAALIDFAFAEYRVERIQARVFAGNTASAKVAGKLGMQFEGVLRSLLVRHSQRIDVGYYSILRQDR